MSVEHVTFGKAIDAVKAGQFATRESWIKRLDPYDYKNIFLQLFDREKAIHLTKITRVLNSTFGFGAWTPSQEDMLATDYLVSDNYREFVRELQEYHKVTYTFEQAIEAVQAGYIARRKEWVQVTDCGSVERSEIKLGKMDMDKGCHRIKYTFINYDGDSYTIEDWVPTIRDKWSNDWYIYK